jgi:hypothetical protein|tara:strand:- start:4112 stop:4222 length:111 start_codon:yes stop_codon:yes gene_type:complete
MEKENIQNKKIFSINNNNCYKGWFWNGKTFKRWGKK